MKRHKTWTKDRGNFTYEFLDGTRVVLKPGEDGVTEADIALLHRMDDREVENNNKNVKPRLQKWQKEGIKTWEAVHPGEKAPALFNVSMDAEPAPDVTDTARKDAPMLDLGSLTVFLEKETSAETEAVREFVDAYLTDEQKMIYQRVMIERESMAAVARDIGVTKQSVWARVNHIKKIFKDNIKNFLSQPYN